jgi:hypothetical protein
MSVIIFFHNFCIYKTMVCLSVMNQTNLFIKIIHQNWSLIVKMGPSCSWSYGSWNYNYLMQSVHVTTNVVSSSPVQARCTQYTCGRLVFLPGTPVSSTNKTDRHDIAEILWCWSIKAMISVTFNWHMMILIVTIIN